MSPGWSLRMTQAMRMGHHVSRLGKEGARTSVESKGGNELQQRGRNGGSLLNEGGQHEPGSET